MSIFSKILVIALSARMLSLLVKQSGGVPVAVDCFADQDTCDLSLECVRVETLCLVDIRPVIERLQAKYDLQYLVYGSGFEYYLDSLFWLQERFTIIGNPANLFARLNDKQALFECFSSLSIPFPETCFLPPDNADGWLRKPKCGAGGLGIAKQESESHDSAGDVYWQQYKFGKSMSVLFAATGHEVALLGFNRQCTVSNERQPFLFAGISNQASISPRWQSVVGGWLHHLLMIYPMRGLGSMDFILSEQGLHVLEINARISASAQLYGPSVFDLHWHSCLGQLIDIEPSLPSAYTVIFAEHDMTVPAYFFWPEWVVDRPSFGAFIGEGEPVCSIIASGTDVADVDMRMQHYKLILEQLFQTGLFNHAIPGKR